MRNIAGDFGPRAYRDGRRDATHSIQESIPKVVDTFERDKLVIKGIMDSHAAQTAVDSVSIASSFPTMAAGNSSFRAIDRRRTTVS